MPKHHVIISGTGRAGTTFLVQLLSALGLDTGFSDIDSSVYPNCNAGMEWDIRNPDAPYIIKSPWLCDYLDEVLQNSEIVIDYAIIPMRDLFSAAESRRHVERSSSHALFQGGIPGGLWHTDNPQQQESVLANQLYTIIYTLAKHDITTVLLYFPRFLQEPKYLFSKLQFLVSGLSFECFQDVFWQVVKPDLIHQFKSGEVNENLQL